MKEFVRVRLALAGLLSLCFAATSSSVLLLRRSTMVNHRNTAVSEPIHEATDVFEREVFTARIAFLYHVTIDKPGSLGSGWEHYNHAQTALVDLHRLATQNNLQVLSPNLDALDESWSAYRSRLDTMLFLVARNEHSGPEFDQAIADWAAEGNRLVGDARDLESTSASLSKAQSVQTGDLLRFSTWIIGLNGVICLLLCSTPLVLMRRKPKARFTDGEGSIVTNARRSKSTAASLPSGKAMRFRFSGLVGLGLLGMFALILVVLGSGVSALRSIVQLRRLQDASAHSEQMLLQAESLRAYVYAAESDTRGYAFSGRPTLLVEQKTEMELASREADKLNQDVTSEPGQKEHVEQLQTALHNRFDALMRISSLRESFGQAAVSQFIATGQGHVARYILQERIADFEAAEYALIQDRRFQADRAASKTRTLLVFAALPASLSLVLLSALTATLLVRSKKLQEQLAFQAGHDVLTKLPNRLSLKGLLSELLRQASHRGTSCAVIAIDIDHFKEVNDQFGHQAGDEFLQQVAERLKSAVRGSDTLVRTGGDEFLCLVSGIKSQSDAEVVAGKLIASLKEPLRLEDGVVQASVSVGFATYPEHASTAATVAVRADQALYRAKTTGRNRFCCFEETADEIRNRKVQRSLDCALKEERFRLVYQPQYTPAGHLRGFEALLRLTDPELGAITPAEFIPLAERSMLIVDIGEWVIQEACTTISSWVRLGLEPGLVAVNVSAAQFADPEFPTKVLEALRRSGISGARLELEVTESMVMSDPNGAADQIRELAKCGVKFAVDDFGTGFSSLTRLIQLPISVIKIDQSFVQGLDRTASSRPLMEAMLALSRAVGAETVAEGVETEAQREVLTNLGCTYLQGYLFSKPLEAAFAQESILHRPGKGLGQELQEGQPQSFVM